MASRLALHGALVIDADEIAREVVEPGTDALARIVKEFGPTVLTVDGVLDRAALGGIVFSDATARATLNSIVHPAVKARSQQLFRNAANSEPDRVVVYAVPLVAESGRGEEFDLVIVVDAPRNTRIDRLVTHRGMTREEATARVDAQASDDERRAIADVIVDASGTVDETIAAADELSAALAENWPNTLELVPPRIPSPAP